MTGRLDRPEPVYFQEWPKIGRLFRDVIITEKIDGSNAAIGVVPYSFGALANGWDPKALAAVAGSDIADDGIPDTEYLVYAQSRSRIITLDDDNFNFARWVHLYAGFIANVIGPGLHFGEWWGSGIQRGYGLQKGDKRFSLFNVKRWEDEDLSSVPGLGVVPLIYEGPFETEIVRTCVEQLRSEGSLAAPGFMNPEGVVTYHKQANVSFKTTLIKDEMSKTEAERR